MIHQELWLARDVEIVEMRKERKENRFAHSHT